MAAAILVADADEVVGQLLDRVDGCVGLHAVRVVGEEHGLLGFDDDEAFFVLCVPNLVNCWIDCWWTGRYQPSSPTDSGHPT